jgi:hypothetical protein
MNNGQAMQVVEVKRRPDEIAYRQLPGWLPITTPNRIIEDWVAEAVAEDLFEHRLTLSTRVNTVVPSRHTVCVVQSSPSAPVSFTYSVGTLCRESYPTRPQAVVEFACPTDLTTDAIALNDLILVFEPSSQDHIFASFDAQLANLASTGTVESSAEVERAADNAIQQLRQQREREDVVSWARRLSTEVSEFGD